MRVSVEISLDPDDFAQVRNVCEAFFLLRGTHLPEAEVVKLNGLVRFNDDDRECFGRMIGNKFSYDDAATGWEVVKRHHTAIQENGNKKLKADADRALASYECFMRSLWDDLRTHRMGVLIAERFGAENNNIVRAAIG